MPRSPYTAISPHEPGAYRHSSTAIDNSAGNGCCSSAKVLCRWAWLACSLRSVAAVTTHLALAREVRACILCVRLLLPGDSIFSCGICEERHDLCTSCFRDRHESHQLGVGERSSRAVFARHPMHREVLPLLVDARSLFATRSTAGALAMTFQIYGPRPCLGTRQAEPGGGFGEYTWMSYAETFDAALNFGSGLRTLLSKVQGGRSTSLVGVLGAVCAQWLISDYGCALKGLGVVLLHRSTGAAQLGHILRATQLQALIISRHLRRLLLDALHIEPETGASLRCIIWLDDPADAHCARQTSHALPDGGEHSDLLDHASEHLWSDVASSGAAQPATTRQNLIDSCNNDAIVKLLPSSGTTGGNPKLTVVTEGVLRDKIIGRGPGSGPAGARTMAGTVIVFAYEVMRQSHDVLIQGGRIGFFSGSLVRMQEDCQRLRPTAFAATPTFWMGLLAQFEAEVRRRSAASEEGAEARTTVEWMDRRILGNRLQILISTGAPCSHRVSRWLFRIFGRTVVNAYGTTETGGLASNGQVSAGAEVRLIDCPQLGYTTADKPHPRGEILAHTRRAAGYFEQGCLRADGSFDTASSGGDDWVTIRGMRYFRTGDIGELIGKGQVRVIDRCKSYFKLSQGVFVAPQPIEEALQESEHVQQLFVWGHSSMSAVACVAVVPAQSSLCEECDGAQRVLTSLQECGTRAGLQAYEIPHHVVLERQVFSTENGLLSAGGKLCRPALIRRYRAELSGNLESGDHDEVYSPAAQSDGIDLCAGLREVLLEVIPPERAAARLVADNSLAALGLDSLGIARLSSRLKDTFGVVLVPRALYSLPTLGDLEAAVFGGDAALRRGAMRANVVDWQKEVEMAAQDLAAELSEHRTVAEISGLPARHDAARKDTVLLTGATGFLGAFLLRALASDGSALGCVRIVCVVRAEDDGSAAARLQDCMDSYGLASHEYCSCVKTGRIAAVAGDLEMECLGLDRHDYFALAARLQCVVHCGARVSAAIPYAALRAANVGGTRRALALALLGAADFVHVSTMGFLPLGHAETRECVSTSLVAQSGYAQSKWVAEQLVTSATSQHGCRARIVRPGVVCGDSKAGASNMKDSTSMLILGLVTEGIVSTDSRSPIPGLFNLCPVDYVAAAIVAIAALPWEQHETKFSGVAFHLCARESISIDVIYEWLRSAGYELNEVATLTFCARISKVGEDHPLFAMKALLSQPAAPAATQMGQQQVQFSTKMVDRAMVLASVELPPRAMTKQALGMAVANLLTRSGLAHLIPTESPPSSTSKFN